MVTTLSARRTSSRRSGQCPFGLNADQARVHRCDDLGEVLGWARGRHVWPKRQSVGARVDEEIAAPACLGLDRLLLRQSGRSREDLLPELRAVTGDAEDMSRECQMHIREDVPLQKVSKSRAEGRD